MKKHYRTFAEINLDAVVHNIRQLKSKLSSGVKMMAVVKADGYGHGAVPVAKAVEPLTDYYGVALAEEGVILRKKGLNKPILVLGVVPEQQFPLLFEYQIMPTVFQLEKAKLLSEMAAAKSAVCRVHLAVDTGMGRIGMFPGRDSVRLVKQISSLPGIKIEGIFTHFAKADEENKDSAGKQLTQFLEFVDDLESAAVHIPVKHAANSAATIDLGGAHLDMVRAGISLYGCYPSDQMQDRSLELKPVLSLKSHITYIKDIPAGMSVSYGGTFTAAAVTRVATIPAGYGDGYPRNQSGKGHVLICGKRADILGRICMDQLMADVTNIPEAKEGDVAVLVGRDQNEVITVEELARLGNGFHYEILCNINKRVPRVYLSGNPELAGPADCCY